MYWSAQGEAPTQTSTVYRIPAGWLYLEAELAAASSSSRAALGQKPVLLWSAGVVKVEQAVGLLKAASRMVPCGKFAATAVVVVVPPTTATPPAPQPPEPSP
jgi:hypothetical protein